jgi:hypothetical protein
MGNFANYVNKEENFTGFDIETNSLTIAKALYPKATFSEHSFEYGYSDKRFNIIVGNPPFNLKWIDGLSQKSFIYDCSNMLKRGGVIALVVPKSFFGDEFGYSPLWKSIQNRLQFIGQYELSNNSFKQMGCKSFGTKVMFFIDNNQYDIEVSGVETKNIFGKEYEDKQIVLDRVSNYKRFINANSIKIQREEKQSGAIDPEVIFTEKLSKLLFEIKQHKSINSQLDEAKKYIIKYRTQVRPKDMEYADWDKIKITKNKVISKLKRIVKGQNSTKTNIISVIRNRSIIRFKGGSQATNAHITNTIKDLEGVEREVSLFEILTGDKTENFLSSFAEIKHYINHEKYTFDEKSIAPIEAWLKKKTKTFRANTKNVEDAQPTNAMVSYVDKFRFDKLSDDNNVTCKFNDIQAIDLAKGLTRNRVGLNWEQGCGKTAVAFAWAKYKMETNNIRNIFILSSAIAINVTWTDYCNINNIDFIKLTNGDQLKSVKRGQVILISTSMVDKMKHKISRFNKINGQKNVLIFDESDAITNPASKLTKATKTAFRKLKYKIIATGTLTRNNLAEIYPQLELVFNNSEYMLSMCKNIYVRNDSDELKTVENKSYNQPFKYRGGFTNFKASFCPSKASVFGVTKQNQDVYNADEITKLIESFCIVRTFEQVVGENKCNHFTHVIEPNASEVELQTEITEKFYEMRKSYFGSTGNSRKDSQLKIMQQMKLMIRSCSTPHLFGEWSGMNECTKGAQIVSLLESPKMVNDIVAIGVTSLRALDYYRMFLGNKYPNREQFIINGDVKFELRKDILKDFEASGNGILIATQTSLENSVNVPTCDNVIIESFQWSYPRMSQFYFRFIRYDSKNKTNVHFIVYNQTIETNLMNLLISKEKTNIFVKTKTGITDSELFKKYNIPEWLTESRII